MKKVLFVIVIACNLIVHTNAKHDKDKGWFIAKETKELECFDKEINPYMCHGCYSGKDIKQCEKDLAHLSKMYPKMFKGARCIAGEFENVSPCPLN